MGLLVGAAAGIIGGILGKKSAKKQARRVEEAAGVAAETFDPFTGPGGEANVLQAGGVGIGGTEASDAAFNNFLGSTGFKARLRAGSEAITGSQAARGLLNSGSTLKRLNTFGQDLAQQGFSNFLGNLGQVANRGLSATGSVANITTGGAGEGAAIRKGGADALQSGIGSAFGGVQKFFGG